MAQYAVLIKQFFTFDMSQELWYTTKCVFIYTCKKITNFPTTIFHENNKYLFILYMDSFEVDNKYGKLVQIFIEAHKLKNRFDLLIFTKIAFTL